MTKGTRNGQTVALINGAAFITCESFCKYRKEYTPNDLVLLNRIFEKEIFRDENEYF